MSSRAERRRAARQKDWQPFDPSTREMPSIEDQIKRHKLGCQRCRTGTVATKGCRWLDEFYQKNRETFLEMLGLNKEPEPDPFEEWLTKKRVTASEDTVRHVEVNEDGTVVVNKGGKYTVTGHVDVSEDTD